MHRLSPEAPQQLDEPVLEIQIDHVADGRAQALDVRRHVRFPIADDPVLACAIRCLAREQLERWIADLGRGTRHHRSEEHTSELQSPCNLVCRLLLEKKKNNYIELRTSQH